MSDTLFLVGLLLPPAVVVAGFLVLLAPVPKKARDRSLQAVRVDGAARLVSH